MNMNEKWVRARARAPARARIINFHTKFLSCFGINPSYKFGYSFF
jgi:hypothetical protein